MAKILSGGMKRDASKKTRPDVHAKTKTSSNKGSQNYKKKDRKSTRLNSSHSQQSRMPSSA